MKFNAEHINMNEVPFSFIGVSLVCSSSFSPNITVQSIGWAMHPSRLRMELIALRSKPGLMERGLIWAGVGYEDVIDNCVLNGIENGTDELISYLVRNSIVIVGHEIGEATWRSLIRALARAGIHIPQKEKSCLT